MEAKCIVEILSTRIVKPSSPTPNHKRRLKLSLLGQISAPIYGPMIYCYNNPSHTSLTILSLQKSLSKALELFYPFAGRLNTDFTSVECNDHGAYFLEAKISSTLSDFLQNPNPKTVTELLPSSDPKTLSDATRNNAVMLVQLTVFSCGGIALGVEVSHKTSDAFSVSRFVKTWAAIATGSGDVAQPVFESSDLLSPPVKHITRIGFVKTPIRSRRFVFSTAKLADLKTRIQKNGVIGFTTPTTVEAVTSLLFKCVVSASGASALLHMVNLRKRLTAKSVPENSIGNLAWPVIVSNDEEILSIELHDISAIIRKGLSEFFNDCKDDRLLKGEALASVVSSFATKEAKLAEAGIGLYWFSALSSFRLYETDFGFGEPEWVMSPIFFKNSFAMMHSKSGQDVEVWATLEEDVMRKFERNEELLAFSSVDGAIDNGIARSSV